MAAALNITVSPGQASEREFELLQILNAALISENKELREQASKANILKIVLGDIAVNVRRCAAFADRAQSTISTNTPSASASVSAPPVEDILPFEKSILRSTSDSSAGELLKFSTWRKGSMQKLLWDNFAENNRTVGSHRGTASAEEASEALDALISCFLTVDQMLQVRFQMKGQAYFEGLEYMLEKSKAGAKTETAVGAESHVEGTETEASVVDECLPRPAIYEVRNNYYGRMNILLSDSDASRICYCTPHGTRYLAAPTVPNSSGKSCAIRSSAIAVSCTAGTSGRPKVSHHGHCLRLKK